MEDKNERFQILFANKISGHKHTENSVNELRIENDNLKHRMNMMQQENKKLKKITPSYPYPRMEEKSMLRKELEVKELDNRLMQNAYNPLARGQVIAQGSQYYDDIMRQL